MGETKVMDFRKSRSPVIPLTNQGEEVVSDYKFLENKPNKHSSNLLKSLEQAALLEAVQVF